MCTFVWCRTSFVCAAVRVACGLRGCGDREGLNFTFTFTVKGSFQEAEKWETSCYTNSGGPAMPDDDEDLDEDSADYGFSDPDSGSASEEEV